MFSATAVISLVLLYMLLLFAIALLVERNNATRVKPYTPALVYALAITVFCTSWTFYGSVELASKSGFQFFAIYIGAILAIFTWWTVLRRMVRIKEAYHITSIADFISARYNRSQLVAVLATLIALIGIIPYIALQLKSVTESFQVLTATSADQEMTQFNNLLVPMVMIAFTILFGARKLDASERNLGMVTVLAVQGVIKLFAFLAVGLFVTYGMYEGLGDVFQRIIYADLSHLISTDIPEGSSAIHLVTLIILGAVAIQCLPRQFHAAVVENPTERHIIPAMWIVPGYLVLISLFVIPIAAAGLMKGLPADQAGTFVLRVPLHQGADWLALVAFIGGFSAATGMVILSTMTLATMATNHLLVGLIEQFKALTPLRSYLLQLRWLMITLIIASGYWFSISISDGYMLAALGMISFVAVFQFAPALFGGLFWRHGNRVGAILGLSLGFLVWFYTLVLPALLGPEAALVNQGPGGINWLRPEQLFGLGGLSPVSHSVFWSFLFNSGGYLLGSLLYIPPKAERNQRSEFMTALVSGSSRYHGRATGLDAYIIYERKVQEALSLLHEYMPDDKAESTLEQVTSDLHIDSKEYLTIIELLEFHRMLEHALAGSIGSAAAHLALEKKIHYSERETRDLQAIYSHIQTELQAKPLNDQPADLSNDDADGLSFIEQLQSTIDELQQRVEQQQQQLDKLHQRLDKSDQKLFDQRVVNQKQLQELEQLRKPNASQG